MANETTPPNLTPTVSAEEINIDYAANDSCEVQCWARGHFEPAAFRRACELALEKWDERQVVLVDAAVGHKVWRTVRAPAELANYGVCEFIHVESRPGRGAYPVTLLENWLPLHRSL